MNTTVRSEAQYRSALAEIDRLMAKNPAADSDDGRKLDLLSVLVEHYEDTEFPLGAADPIAAIRFRMDQEGLTQRDLVPLIGSRSKVSEVLSGKRPLTLPMIRALHRGLDIPAEALIAERATGVGELASVDWSRFPVREMSARGWVSCSPELEGAAIRDCLLPWLEEAFAPSDMAVVYRRTRRARASRQLNSYALLAWTAQVVHRSTAESELGEYAVGSVDAEFLGEVARLSWSDRGPTLAREYLAKHGVALVVEPHLPKTHLDGASVLGRANPVIGLTLRYDRLDNFWFTLLHELAHVALAQDANSEVPEILAFYDDLDSPAGDEEDEIRADALAGEALIPSAEWRASAASRVPTPEAAEQLARRLGIHPAIVAGRMRHERRNYKILSQMVGTGEVRQQFSEAR
jgi:HTH-type transcriptional regulator / antitoxin HigA